MLALDIIQIAVLYVALVVLWVWRMVFPWKTGENWRKCFNHVTLLYILVGLLYLSELSFFAMAAMKDIHSTREVSTNSRQSATLVEAFGMDGEREWPIGWLRYMVLSVPAVVLLVILLSWHQNKQHLHEIRQDIAQWQHDRVISILALPMIYAVVTMAGMARVYELVVDESSRLQDGSRAVTSSSWKQDKSLTLARWETCLYVGDLYEAWALFQFGKLTVELLQEHFPEEQDSRNPFDGPSRRVSMQAISSVMWLGTGMFIAVNAVQTGWALYMWLFEDPAKDWEFFEFGLNRFSYAGLVASSAAIYNVHVVESTFGHYIDGYSPFTKFLSVKILVWFAFWQGPTLYALKYFHMLTLTDVQLRLFQSVLLVYECLFAACLHLIAWDVKEPWYARDNEKAPLMDSDKKV